MLKFSIYWSVDLQKIPPCTPLWVHIHKVKNRCITVCHLLVLFS